MPRASFCAEKESNIMIPAVPGDAIAGALEMVCYFFTIVAAVTSYVLTMRF